VRECVHCHVPTDRIWFDMTMCEPCEKVQRESLSRIAHLVHPVKWWPPDDWPGWEEMNTDP
jgi:hypothetical protein